MSSIFFGLFCLALLFSKGFFGGLGLIVADTVAIIAHSFGVGQLIGVRAAGRQLGPAELVVAKVAHSFRIVLGICVGTPRDRLLLRLLLGGVLLTGGVVFLDSLNCVLVLIILFRHVEE